MQCFLENESLLILHYYYTLLASFLDSLPMDGGMVFSSGRWWRADLPWCYYVYCRVGDGSDSLVPNGNGRDLEGADGTKHYHK